MFCSYCETKIFKTDRVCPSCGAPIKNLIKTIERSLPEYHNCFEQCVGIAFSCGNFKLDKNENNRILKLFCICAKGCTFRINPEEIDYFYDKRIIEIDSFGKVTKKSFGKTNIKAIPKNLPNFDANILCECKFDLF